MLKRRTGRQGERAAERHLKKRGLTLVTRNWHCRHGEIDLIMHDDEYLVFVEVRLRSRSVFGGGLDSVDVFKQQRLTKAAALFLADQPRWQQHPCRFDVVGIERDSGKIDWLQHAFEAQR
ncbi:MAG: YraN family protein [Pseudomonadota bacterium]